MSPDEMAARLKRLTAPRTVRRWGQEETITPYLVERVWGDGLCIKAIVPLNTRPNFYVVRLDSGFYDLDEDDAYDVCDEVLTHLEKEEVGPMWPLTWGMEEDWPPEIDGAERPWPAIDLGAGWVMEDVYEPPGGDS